MMSKNNEYVTIEKGAASSLLVISCTIVWLGLSVVTSTTTKKLVDAVPLPITLTMLQLLTSITYTFFCNIVQETRSFFKWRKSLVALSGHIWAIACMRLGSRIFHKLALLSAPVSFVYTTKITSPFFTLGFAYLLLGEITPPKLCVPLIPLLLGVTLCGSSEIQSSSTSLSGIFTALLSVFMISLSTVLTKKTLQHQPSESLPFLLFSDFTAVIFIFPFWFILDILGTNLPGFYEIFGGHQPKVTESFEWINVLRWDVFGLLALNGVGHVGQGILGLWIMRHLSAVSFAVVGVAKRVIVVVGTILVFREDVNLMKGLGMTLGFLGVCWYAKNKLDSRTGGGGGGAEAKEKWKGMVVDV